VTPAPARPPRATLGLLGLGVTLIGVAVALRPVHVARVVFWLVLVAGGVCLTIAIVIVLRSLLTGSGTQTRRAVSRRLVGADCWRVHEALAGFLDEQDRARRHNSDVGLNGDGDHEWRQTTTRRYKEEFGVWAPQVFEAAIASAAASPTSRRLVEAPAAAQIPVVRDLFRDAALTLEHE
jgi:hypothetical protein